MTWLSRGPLYRQPRTVFRRPVTPIRSRRRNGRTKLVQWAVVVTIGVGIVYWGWSSGLGFGGQSDDGADETALARLQKARVSGVLATQPAPAPGHGSTRATAPARVKVVARTKRSTPTVKPAGPAKRPLPSTQPAVASSLSVHARRVVLPAQNSVPDALLRAARDCVARRIIAVWGTVRDETSMRAADVDQVARGLGLAGFDLRTAMIRHRARAARKYAKSGKPRTQAAFKRVLTTRNVIVFLESFAEKLPTATGVEDAPNWLPGDIVVVKPSKFRSKLMLAVVSDRTDDDGQSLLFTLDPRDKRAREQHTLADYPVRGHFRLTHDRLVRAAMKLGMKPARTPVTL